MKDKNYLGHYTTRDTQKKDKALVRQKARVLHKLLHKVGLCVGGIARSQVLRETNQRNFEVMQSIMKFSWCIYSSITPTGTCFQLLAHSLELFNWIKQFNFCASGNFALYNKFKTNVSSNLALNREKCFLQIYTSIFHKYIILQIYILFVPWVIKPIRIYIKLKRGKVRIKVELKHIVRLTYV